MSRLFTKRGYDSITEEINFLWNEERPMVLQEVHDAALQGDRSENAAYIYGKQRMRMIDKRLRILRQKIKDVKVVDTDALPPSPIVSFGALVTLEDEDGKVMTLRLVDKEEINPERMLVSVQSPIGRAMLGKEEGDEFDLVLPKGTVTYDIITVHYGPEPDGYNPDSNEESS